MIRKFSLIIYDNLFLICGNLFPSSQKSDCKQKALFCLHIDFSFPLMLEAKNSNLKPRAQNPWFSVASYLLDYQKLNSLSSRKSHEKAQFS